MNKPQSLQRMLHREWPHILLAVRGTIAALAALTVAVVLKLQCPYWAAMTALIIIQPTRGLLLEKSFYRLVGTAIGSVAGLMLLLTARSPIMLTILLSLWLAGCTGIGNVLYGLRSYAALLAGYTCAVISMIGYQNQSHLHDLAFGRIACIIIGIVVSTTLTLFFTHRRSKRELLERLRKVTVASIEWVALLVRGTDQRTIISLRQNILMELADIESTLDAAWAGSLDLKCRTRRVRNLIVSLLSLLEAGKLATKQLDQKSSHNFWREPLAVHLEEVAQHLDEHGSFRPETPDLNEFLAEAGAHLPLLGDTLGELVNSLQLVIDEWESATPDIERPASNTFIRHRDWQEAGRAAGRAACAISVVGLLWHVTGWKDGPLMLMSTAIMVSLFSTNDHPVAMVSEIFCGALVGVAAAFLYRLVLLPGVSDPILQGAISAPILMAGIIALSHQRTSRGAMDAMLFFLFVMQPGMPAVTAPHMFVSGGLACLMGIAVAILAFRFLLPVDPSRRLCSVLASIVHDLNGMVAADSLPAVERCRARTHHRVLRMLAISRKSDHDLGAIVEGGLAALAIGRCLQRLRETTKNGEISPAADVAMRDMKVRLTAAINRPEEILPVLEEVSARLCTATESRFEARFPSIQEDLPAGGEAGFLPHRRFFAGREKGAQCPT